MSICVDVFLYLLYTIYNKFQNSKEKTFLGYEGIVTGPRDLKGLFWGLRHGFKIQFRDC